MAVTTPASVASSFAPEAVRRRLTQGKRDVAGVTFRTSLQIALAIALVILGVLLVDVWLDGSSVLLERFSGFMSGTLQSRPEIAGIAQGLRGSFWIGVFVVVLAFPLGVGAALYLEEYAAKSRLTRIIDINIRNLAGVPSVVYGILGFTIFVKSLGSVTGGRTVIAAGITLAILVLPVVIITSAEAIRAVPQGLREAGFGIGATRWEVTRDHVIPYAAPGILTGTVLSLARALGEAAPLILVGAVTGRLGDNPSPLDIGALDSRFTAMPSVITSWAGQPDPAFRQNTAAAIIVLMAVVLIANSAAILLRNHFETKRG